MDLEKKRILKEAYHGKKIDLKSCWVRGYYGSICLQGAWITSHMQSNYIYKVGTTLSILSLVGEVLDAGAYKKVVNIIKII